MPYPLEKLQYGLRRRLRELATRSEAYDFQIAAPNYYGLQPIQKVHSLEEARFKIDTENNLKKLVYPKHLGNSYEIPLYVVSDELEFKNFTSNYELNVILDDFRLAPKQLDFYDCLLDMTFIQSFVNAVDTPTKCMEFRCSTLTSEMAANMLCNSPALSTLETFSVYEPSFPSATGWIQALMAAGCTSLKYFNVWYDSPFVFDIGKDDLAKFINAQPDGFTLAFHMPEEMETHSTTKLLEELFDDQFFDLLDISKIDIGLKICIGSFELHYTIEDV